MADEPTPPTPDETPDPQSDAEPAQVPAEIVPGDSDDMLTATGEPRQPQDVTVEDVGPAKKKLTIELPEQRIKDKLVENFDELQEEATLPGFRRGRAPKRLIEKRFGADVRNEVKNQLITDSLRQAVEEKELRVLGEPDIKDLEELELPEQGPLTFEVEIEIVPEFERPDLSELKLEKPVFEVTDEQVTAELDRFREMQGAYQPVEGGADVDDFVTGPVTIRDAEGEVIEQRPEVHAMVAGESRDFRGHLAGIVIDDLGKQLVGKTGGDVLNIEMTGPSQHEDEKIREQPIKIEFTVKRVERMEPASIDQVLTQVGFESEDELREHVRNMLEGRQEREQQQAMQQQVTDALLDRVEIDLPEDLSNRQAAQTMERRATDLMMQGASQQDIEENLAELRSASEEQAKRDLKLFFIVDRLSKEMDVEVADAEVNAQLTQMAMQSGRRPERLRQEMRESGRLDQLYMSIREQKTLQALVEQAEVEEVDGEEWRKRKEAERAAEDGSDTNSPTKNSTADEAKADEEGSEPSDESSDSNE